MQTQAVLQRRILTILVIAQILSGAGLAAGITVGALLAQDVLESTSLAGVPAALFTIGAALSAIAVGRISQHHGRRVGLSVGYATGAVGSAGVVIAATIASTPLLFGALFVYGAGMATNLQARYAGADLATPERRGTAISIVLMATTVGAVIGPNTVTVTGDLAQFLSIPSLAGPFLLAAVAYGVAALVLWMWLRPDPLLLARTLPVESEPQPGAPAGDSWQGAVILGAAVMAVTQAVMIAIMTMTPIHMQHHGHSLGATGMVIGLHVAAMYLPSPISGVLVDRYGTRPVAALAAVVLVVAGISAALSTSVTGLVVALVLLGLGWNLGLVSGTTMITAHSPLESRARIQGNVDLSITLAGAGGGFASGAVVAATSYTLLSVAGGILSMLIIPLLIFAKVRSLSGIANARRRQESRRA